MLIQFFCGVLVLCYYMPLTRIRDLFLFTSSGILERVMQMKHYSVDIMLYVGVINTSDKHMPIVRKTIHSDLAAQRSFVSYLQIDLYSHRFLLLLRYQQLVRLKWGSRLYYLPSYLHTKCPFFKCCIALSDQLSYSGSISFI